MQGGDQKCRPRASEREKMAAERTRSSTGHEATDELSQCLTLRLLMSYIYMELLVKPGMLTSYIYGPTFGNAETVCFYLLHNVSTLNQCREVSCVTFVCKHFAS